MPARSQAQRALLAARFGQAWMRRHHFDNKGPLPAHAGDHRMLNHARKRAMRKGR